MEGGVVGMLFWRWFFGFLEEELRLEGSMDFVWGWSEV